MTSVIFIKSLWEIALKYKKDDGTILMELIDLYDFKSFAQVLPIDSGTFIAEVNISYKGIIEIEINSDSDINYLKVK
jgi:hypothetical protein